jgi:hypothetical protein
VSTAREDFLRRYATSPIHVPRLERLLAVYETDDEDDAFARRFIGWDRASSDAEAARIVTEVISTIVDRTGRIVRLSDEAVQGAIRWIAEATSPALAERARMLGEGLSSNDDVVRRRFVQFLETQSGWR